MKTRLFAAENRQWWTLAAVAVGLFMIMLDNTVVNVARPSIQQDLGVSPSGLEGAVSASARTFGVLRLSGGKLADMLGRRRIFIVGLVVFTGASLWCGLAGGATSLIAARTLQGIGAALMNPATLSIITATFPPERRGTAIGIWAGVSALALAIRPLQGPGAALMTPATLSIITATFPPEKRGTAIGIWAGVSALALAIGPLLG